MMLRPSSEKPGVPNSSTNSTSAPVVLTTSSLINTSSPVVALDGDAVTATRVPTNITAATSDLVNRGTAACSRDEWSMVLLQDKRRRNPAARWFRPRH